MRPDAGIAPPARQAMLHMMLRWASQILARLQALPHEIRLFWNYVRDNPFKAAKAPLLGAVFILCSGPYPDPTTAFVADLAASFNRAGAITIAIYIGVKTFAQSNPLSSDGINRILLRLLVAITGFNAARWTIHHAGDDAYISVTTEPSRATAVALSLALVALLLWTIARIAPALRKEPDATEYQIAMADTEPRRASRQDIAFASVHEAGHAIAFGALFERPDEVALRLYAEPARASLGNFSYSVACDLLTEARFTENQMLIDLAGTVAEQEIYGRHTTGSTADHQDWTHRAEAYLGNFERGLFYYRPTSQIQQQHNETKLTDLYQEHRALLVTLFSMNRDLLKDLADELARRKHLDLDALRPYFGRIIRPGPFPQPLRLDLPIDPDPCQSDVAA